MKKKAPSFKKSQNDDLTSMRIGITGYMGHVHFEIAPCVSINMDELSPDASRADVVAFVKNEVDKSIHRSYRIYPCNYIAYDILNGDNAYAGKSYTEVDKISFMQYVEKQLDKHSYMGICEELNLGVSVIFQLLNMKDYVEYKKK